MRFFTLILTCLLLTGCESIALKHGYVKKSAAEAQISQLINDKEVALNNAVNEVILAKDSHTNKILENFQWSADYIYGARLGVELVPNKDRLWNIIDYRLRTAASYAPAPSREALELMAKSLKEELDLTKTTNEELAAKYDAEVVKGKIAIKEQANKEAEITAKEAELAKNKEEFNAKILSAHAELNKINDQLLSAEKTRANNAADIEKTKRWAASLVGGLALAALAGAIFSPLFKDKLAILAAILGAVAISILFLTPLMVGAGLAFILLVVGTVVTIKFSTSEKVNGNLINAIDDLRTSDPITYETSLKGRLKEWNSKYKTVWGKVEKVKDGAVEKYIEGKLVEKERI